MDILVRDGEPKSRPPGSKSTTSFSRNTDLSKSKSTNRCVTFFGKMRRGIARRRASEQSWLKISQKVPTTLEHQGLRNSQNQTGKKSRLSLSPKKITFQRVWFLRKKKPRQPAPISFLDFFLTFVMTYTRLCRAYQSDCSALPENYISRKAKPNFNKRGWWKKTNNREAFAICLFLISSQIVWWVKYKVSAPRRWWLHQLR